VVVKRHMGALAGKGESDRPAEPLSRSGNQHHLAAQLEIDDRPPPRSTTCYTMMPRSSGSCAPAKTQSKAPAWRR
jgi:hypothetical protein